MKEKNKNNFWKAVVVLAVALAFIMPSAAVVANFETIGIPSNNENTADIKNIEGIINDKEEIINDNSDSSEYTEVAIEKTNTDTTRVLPTRGIIYVGSGLGNDSATIQGGINLAGAGDTVYVYDGTYYEHVTVDRQLDLIAQSINVIVDGSEYGNVFYVTADNVTADSFTLKNGGYGVYLNSVSNCTFTNCRVIDNFGSYGFYGSYSDFTSIIGGEYSRNGFSDGYNIYMEYSDHVTIDNVIVDDPVQGLGGSCPFIYTWNGDEFEFINELDAGQLGDSIAPLDVEFREKIDGDQLQPLDGKYEIRYTEELDEVSYLDLMELWTIEHEPGVEIYTDWTTNDNLFTVVDPVPPISAVDHNGEDVLSLIAAKDWDAWTSDWGELEDWANMTADEIVENLFSGYITLKLGDWSETPENLKLVITDNRERESDPESKAAAKEILKHFQNLGDNSILRLKSGTKFQVKNALDIWVDAPLDYQKMTIPTIDDVIRYVSSPFLPRTLVADLSGLDIPDNEIRYMISNPYRLQHIDQILVDTSPPQEVDITVLKPSYANLDYRGSTLQGMRLLSSSSSEYTYNYTYREELFDVNYSNVLETSPKQKSGNLTRYGDVLPLIQSINDEYVTIAKGDELSLQFDYTAPGNGMETDFIFREFGYYKMSKSDLGDTVEPLPFEDMTMYPYDESIEQYDYDNHTDYIENYQTRAINEHGTACGIKLYNSNNFMISNVSGSPQNFEEYDEIGIQIYQSNDGTIENSILTDGWNEGIHLYYSSSNNNIINCTSYNNERGIYVSYNSNDNNIIDCTAYGDIPFDDSYYGIYIQESSGCDIINSNVYSTVNGITISWYSDNNTIINCNVYDHASNGITFQSYSNNNNITDCDIYNNDRGIYFRMSSNAKLRGNTIHGNTQNLAITTHSTNPDINNFYHDIDPSNTIEGRAIWYLVGINNFELNETHNFGYLGLVSCTNILARNADVGGILLVNTTDSTISNVSSHDSLAGIQIFMSSDNDIIDCDVYDNGNGIALSGGSSGNNFINCNAYDNYAGITSQGSSYNNITNCNIYNNKKGIYFRNSDNNIITNCNVYNNTGDVGYKPNGIDFDDSSNNKLRGNTLYNNSRYEYQTSYNFGVDGEVLSHFTHDIDATNTVNGRPIFYLVGQENIILDGSVIDFGFIGLISCTNMTVKNADINDVLVINTTDSTISNVDVHNGLNGIYLYWSSNNVITNCNIISNRRTGIRIFYSSDNVITNCTIYNTVERQYGFLIADSLNNDIINCNISGSGTGIQISDDSPYTSITNCVIYNNTRDGINGMNTHNINITNCVIYNNDDDGIYFVSVGNSNIINCNIYNNGGRYGIYLYNSDNANIINCDVYNNAEYGIYLRYSDDVMVHHNNLFDNVVNAYDGATNQWDDGSEGNYWDDYTGVDGDGNGIGDTPYVIDYNSQDNYPFMNPNEWLPKISDVTITTSDPLDTEPGFGWENFSCTVTDISGVDEVKLVLTGDTTTEYPMIKDGDDYYCNITISTVDEYAYHIWANDTSDNEDTSTPQPFDLPPNYDVNMDGRAHLQDFVLVAGHYGEYGPYNGWIREDVNNDGRAHLQDFVLIAGHYNEYWK